MNIAIYSFEELSINTLYDILALRNQVFIVEQQCVYQDLDFKDQQARHLLVYDAGKLIAYARILPFNHKDMSFGRLVTAQSHRRFGLGKQLMASILTYLQTHFASQAIVITAQQYLQHFYQSYGFLPEGEPFDMDGILHIKMVKAP
ncbi:GNAT family N-acetyltransferase [Legionella jordanis]|uniref:GNAT family acetyltransferase n=1 Tax=Legionella jordanis TaxID=456 RepID=A0A0W0VBB4_9GAMM|nr:GNAT family N-acetyltransferase [Legionella jordanis]KTD17410.1 GNAT family acetyltransferase [Legionella jordanis]RMX01825.1 GNAT family N-acetyltransferase [Legionella jordanis]RMX15489.1 GNAT family N-acetyltransferase [Legionella jordanis]VEH11569.1 acyltransferase [Legionella jordanis]HAT8714643.1 GNAT family N-acetyltransferase [Legionella jordanis]